MTRHVNWAKTSTEAKQDAGSGQSDLRAVVRFLARCAAERTWKTLKTKESDPHQHQGGGP